MADEVDPSYALAVEQVLELTGRTNKAGVTTDLRGRPHE